MASARCHRPCWQRRRNDLDGAAHEARSADALKVEVAGEIVAAGRERLQRRIEQRFDFDEGAGGRRHAALDREPHALRLLVHAAAVDAVDAQHKAVGVWLSSRSSTKPATVTPDAGKRRIGWSISAVLSVATAKPAAMAEEPEHDNEADWAAPQQHGDSDGGDCGR